MNRGNGQTGRELTSEQIENRRQVEHVVWLFVAFLLPYIDRLVLLLIGVLGLFYALVLSPRLIRITTRSEERQGYSRAKLSYALASLTALLVFFDRAYIGAGAFAILAVGDALSNLVGRYFGGPRFPYNPRKTLAGSLALWVGGGLAAWVVILWNRPEQAAAPLTWLIFSLVAGLVCAAIESLPQVIDDNITIVWVGACVFYVLFSLETFTPGIQGSVMVAVLVNLACAAVAVGLGWLTVPATLLAFCLGVLSLLSLGWPGYLCGLVFVLLGSLFTRVGLRRKEQRGIAQPGGGRRGVSSVAGKGVVPLAIAVAYSFGQPAYLAIAYVAAFCTAAFDTAATEIGQWLSAHARSPFSCRRVPAGSPGAISWQGTVAGLLAGLAIAAIPSAFGWLPFHSFPVLGAAACFGNFIESVIKTADSKKTEPGSGIFNLYTTMAGACAAAAAWLLIGD